jgi:hypothetical protein
MGRYMYRDWLTNMYLKAAGVWHFYDGRAAMEPRISELREDYALRKIPTSSFAANALYLKIIRPTTWSMLFNGIAWRNPGKA